MSTPEPNRGPGVAITNCHVHTFTHRHVPDRFVYFRPLTALLRLRAVRVPLLGAVRRWDAGRRSRLARYARVVEISHDAKDQEGIFRMVRGFYPKDTRFVVLPMDMTHLGAGTVDATIDQQHEKLAELAARPEYRDILLPFSAVDPRQPNVVDKTIALLERGFRGIKLYPPIGYHPYDRRLHRLYAYAEERDVPVLSHCSHPAGVSYRGPITDAMRENPTGGPQLPGERTALLEAFTEPKAYVPIFESYPRLRVCLAHWGGPGDWRRYLENPWDSSATMCWVAQIRDWLRDQTYPNLYTDIAYTVFAGDEYVHMLDVLLQDGNVASRVLFGSDFYVVEDAENEERRIAMRIRSVLGDRLFRQISEENPRRYLGETTAPVS